MQSNAEEEEEGFLRLFQRNAELQRCRERAASAAQLGNGSPDHSAELWHLQHALQVKSMECRC